MFLRLKTLFWAIRSLDLVLENQLLSGSPLKWCMKQLKLCFDGMIKRDLPERWSLIDILSTVDSFGDHTERWRSHSAPLILQSTVAGDGGVFFHHHLQSKWKIKNSQYGLGREGVWSPKEELTVDKISIKLHLTGKSRLIIPFYRLMTPLVELTEILKFDSSLRWNKNQNKTWLKLF